ncbi:ATP-binding protein [Vampirovibrio sp.]|uniref:ATP-binding protein n=1 Tax=Vampirovibrio sp. TaxID=2717857 RepID=UPI003593583F
MITRFLEVELKEQLAHFPAVALLGPRQVGKTTLARYIGAGADYLDLENPADLQKLEDARGYLVSRQGRLVILDEIQRKPELFQVLRGLIDERILAGEPAGHFLLLGSASIDLLRQSSETLAGRIAYLELYPIQMLEVGQAENETLWVRGGFPRSLLASSDAQSVKWRENFISTYLERDIPQLGPRIPAETLRRFWTMLAHSQGTLLNAAQLAKSLAVDGKTVAKYLDLMVDLLMVRRLPPHHVNVKKRLVKSPKIYVRDSGLLHALLLIDTQEQLLGHPIVGMSWEGHVIETLLCYASSRCQASFYRTATGVEIDLVLELPGNQTWAIEIKRGYAPKLEHGFHVAVEDLQPQKSFAVYSGQERYPKGSGIEVISLAELAQEIANLC